MWQCSKKRWKRCTTKTCLVRCPTKKWQDGFVRQRTKWKHQAPLGRFTSEASSKFRQEVAHFKSVVQQVPKKLPVESGGNATVKRNNVSIEKERTQELTQELNHNVATVVTHETVTENTECGTKTQRTRRRKKARWEGTQEPNSQEHRENNIKRKRAKQQRAMCTEAAKTKQVQKPESWQFQQAGKNH